MHPHKAVEILYRDDSLLVVNKPPGMLSIPGRDQEEVSVLELLRSARSDLLPVHRLDRDTSGVMLIAIGADAHRTLSTQFSDRDVEKTYVALVIGRPAEDNFVVDLPLLVDRHQHTRISRDGKPSRTLIHVIERFSRFSYLEARPVTGRQHQIRAHLAAIGHPLAVDPEYGRAEPITIRDIKPAARRTEGSEERGLLRRTPLHARSLKFRHPVDGREMHVEAPILKDMQAMLNQLRKWGR